MTDEQRVAYINAMVTCALIEAKGMEAENMQRQARGQSMTYTYEAFEALIEKYGIHHNAVMGYFRD